MQKVSIRRWIEKQAEHGKITFTLEELKAAFMEMPLAVLRAGLYREKKRKTIVGVWRGFYLILPLEYRGVGMMPPGEFIDKLMAYLGRPYCVSLLNAAAIYGAAHQRPMRFTVMTSNPPLRSTIKGANRIDFIAKRSFGKVIPAELTRRVKTQYGAMNVTTPEFTALSLVQYVHASGGLSHVLTVLAELMEACHWEQLPDLLMKNVPVSAAQRLGYMMDRLLGESAAADSLHRQLTSRFRLHPVPLSPGEVCNNSDMDEKWKVIINAHPENDLDD